LQYLAILPSQGCIYNTIIWNHAGIYLATQMTKGKVKITMALLHCAHCALLLCVWQKDSVFYTVFAEMHSCFPTLGAKLLVYLLMLGWSNPDIDPRTGFHYTVSSTKHLFLLPLRMASRIIWHYVLILWCWGLYHARLCKVQFNTFLVLQHPQKFKPNKHLCGHVPSCKHMTLWKEIKELWQKLANQSVMLVFDIGWCTSYSLFILFAWGLYIVERTSPWNTF